MSLMKYLASISLAAITLPLLHAEPRCPGNIVSLTFHLVQGSRMIVPVVVNHTGPYEFVVDTGTRFTRVDPLLATELHLTTKGSIGVDGVGVSTDASFAYLDLLEAGSHNGGFGWGNLLKTLQAFVRVGPPFQCAVRVRENLRTAQRQSKERLGE
jgi:Aspartyl protease